MMRLEPQALVQAAKIISKNSNFCIWHLLHCHRSTIWFIQYTLHECMTFPSLFGFMRKVDSTKPTSSPFSEFIKVLDGSTGVSTFTETCWSLQKDDERWAARGSPQWRHQTLGALGFGTPKIPDFESLLIYPICNGKIYILGTFRHPSRKIQHRPLYSQADHWNHSLLELSMNQIATKISFFFGLRLQPLNSWYWVGPPGICCRILPQSLNSHVIFFNTYSWGGNSPPPKNCGKCRENRDLLLQM